MNIPQRSCTNCVVRSAGEIDDLHHFHWGDMAILCLFNVENNAFWSCFTVKTKFIACDKIFAICIMT